MKRWKKTQRPRAICEFDIANVLAGIIVGDDWVQALIVHVDPRGAVYPIRSRWREIKTPPGLIPGLDSIREAIVGCWQDIHEQGTVEYSRFVLGLPPWCTTGRDTRAETMIECDERLPPLQLPRIRSHHVQALEECASQAGIPDYSVAIDMIPLSYELENGKRTQAPRGQVSPSLKLRAHTISADLGITLGILHSLHLLGIRVHEIMSSHVASTRYLSDDEKDVGSVVVDVGQRHTLCSFFSDGLLRHVAHKQDGIRKVHAEIAQKLRTTSAKVAACIREREQLLFIDDPNDNVDSLPLFRWSTMPRSTKGLEDAAFPAASRIMLGVKHCITVAQKEMMVPVRNIILISDDPLTLRIMKFLSEEQLEMCCRIAHPPQALGTPELHVMARTRTFGFFLQAVLGPPRRQVFLDRYNETMLDTFARNVSTRATDASLRVLRRLVDATTGRAATDPGAVIPASVAQEASLPHRQFHTAVGRARESLRRASQQPPTPLPENLAAILQ
jgi:hypothetical protein